MHWTVDGISYGAILYRDWRWRRQYVCCIFKSLALSSRASLSFNCRPFSDDDDDFPVLWANQTQAFFPVVQAKLCSLFFWSNNSHTWAMLTYSSLQSSSETWSSREDSTNLYVILLAWKPATSSEKHSITPACKHWGWLLMNVLILLGHSNSRNKELKQI